MIAPGSKPPPRTASAKGALPRGALSGKIDAMRGATVNAVPFVRVPGEKRRPPLSEIFE
jgi:hypothetical protein